MNYIFGYGSLIEQASRMLSALPEKKALIYFAAGVSKTGIDNQAQLEASINAAVKANLAIYPIDTRGLMAGPPGGGARADAHLALRLSRSRARRCLHDTQSNERTSWHYAFRRRSSRPGSAKA